MDGESKEWRGFKEDEHSKINVEYTKNKETRKDRRYLNLEKKDSEHFLWSKWWKTPESKYMVSLKEL